MKQDNKVNALYYYANKYRQKPIEEAEIEAIDMTEVFWKEIETMIKEGEIIILNINGKPRTGKSTVGFSIGDSIFNYLIKYKFKDKKEKFGLRNIARDQQEKSVMMRDDKTQFTVIVTDESNELEKTGENVTVEMAFMKLVSDVMASRYVHGVSISPNEVIDPNADILIEVKTRDVKDKKNFCKLFYRYFEGGNQYIQLLGHIIIDVEKIVKVWENVKPVFYRPNRTEKEEQYINDMRRIDWYTEYVIKKHEKMDLITKEGIFKPRVLQYAGIILDVCNELMDITQYTNLSKDMIKNFIKMKARKYKIPLSVLGEELITREVSGVLEAQKGISKTQYQIDKLEKQYEKGDVTTIIYEVTKKKLYEIKAKHRELVNLQIEELKRFELLKKKYETILT